MLFIDDDEPQLGERQEQRRARPHDNAGAAIRDGAPSVAARALRHIGVPFRRHRTEPAPEAIEPLRAQRDLGQQHQHLTTRRESRGDRGEIGLGLARAGHAVEHGHGKLALANPLDQTLRRGFLVGR